MKSVVCDDLDIKAETLRSFDENSSVIRLKNALKATAQITYIT